MGKQGIIFNNSSLTLINSDTRSNNDKSYITSLQWHELDKDTKSIIYNDVISSLSSIIKIVIFLMKILYLLHS